MKIPKKSRVRENIEAILVAILLALLIRTFFVQAFKIPSGSMKQTLQIGDHILVNKFLYGIRIPLLRKVIIQVKKPTRGDIIVFKFPVDPDKDFIKRVIGVAGDMVESRNKKIFVNNQLINEDYSIRTDSHIIPGGLQKRDNFGPLKVPENSLFVMGDNRDQSFDSRFWGFVDLKVVSGKAFMIYWSWDQENFGVRWKRIGRILK
ncbi:MAG: signal peptidase I [Deltaproteobacteria bacterium]|nr:MAG: signal peptidase I [Deltaproteobacteria bacterium]